MEEKSKFDVIDVDAHGDFEQLGTKEKFWFDDVWNGTDEKYLFKYSRANTGEHWSEKGAEELCKYLHIPHAEYHFAKSEGRLGVLTANLAPDGYEMIMGNQVLYTLNPEVYPMPEHSDDSFMHIKEHTTDFIFESFQKYNILPPENSSRVLSHLDASDIFCGYLMLDTLISNQDRHHENWAVLVNSKIGQVSLCPTFDHAASLGRELTDIVRKDRLYTKDQYRSIESFVSRARSELFDHNKHKKPLKTIDAFYYSVKDRETTKQFWLSMLEKLTEEKVISIFNSFPDNVITPLAREFATKMIMANKNRLLEDERA